MSDSGGVLRVHPPELQMSLVMLLLQTLPLLRQELPGIFGLKHTALHKQR